MGRATARLGTVLLAAGLAAAGAPCVQATTLLHQDLGDLVDRAELIFVGTVLHAESVLTGDGAFAFTYVTFEVEDALKGSARDRQLTLRFAGGELEEVSYSVVGIPRFAPGGRHLLFVEGNGRLGVPLVGWGQGRLDFVAHPLSGESILVDFRGQGLAGVADGEWVKGGPLVEGGLLVAPREPGLVVVSQEGVEITVEDPAAELAGKPAPAAEVVEALRAHVQARSKAPSFRAPRVVESASPADVPPSFHFQAYPASGR